MYYIYQESKEKSPRRDLSNYTEGMGPKKKIAEMIAAEEMCDVIGLLYTST
ncbi:hypothetical protein LCGC14_0697910 [marine sediment metagenome]|uniref:Uncharacterized protein n=1 Tax=marine sediment metagenome TaxID=412755 RepID=A0A0F9R415_9ZZZZ